jgi:hypothetical protein
MDNITAFKGVCDRMVERYRTKGVDCQGSSIPPASFVPAVQMQRMTMRLNRFCQEVEERGESTDKEMADLALNLAILSVLYVLTIECASSGRDG